MFAQVIQGRTSDREAVRAAAEQWVRDLSPGAEGWLGSTMGVTDDGRFFALVRFESAEAARRNSDRPEQGRWWEQTQRLFDGEVAFLDSTDVEVETVSDPDRAGFVQVMQGQATDLPRVRELMADFPLERVKDLRPDILGAVSVAHAAGRWTRVMYFTSEAEAREGERREPPAQWVETMRQASQLAVGETDYLDLREPVLHSPH